MLLQDTTCSFTLFVLVKVGWGINLDHTTLYIFTTFEN
jgi:hypothetical protein